MPPRSLRSLPPEGALSALRAAERALTMVIKSPKAASAAECLRLEQLPNVGPAIAADLRLIGIERPADLRDKDAWNLYRALCEKTGVRQDPCVLDTLMAATDFMRGAPAAPWWKYTAERKATFGPV